MCRCRCLGTSPVRLHPQPRIWPLSGVRARKRYRVVSTVTSTAASDLKVIHHRPAVIQELSWRPRYGARRAACPDTESVEQVVFGFHDGRLFRVTVDYDREQTKGLIDADMVEAISAVYGPPGQALGVEEATGAVRVRRFRHSYRAVGVTRTTQSCCTDCPRYATSFRLIVTAEPIAALARTAAARALVHGRDRPH